MALSKSLPTPNTQEPAPVVTSVVAGAPEPAERLALAPTPLAPVKLITVIDDNTLCESVAVTLAPLKGDPANARQISDEPLCAFVRTTKLQVSPPPVTLFTVVFAPPR